MSFGRINVYECPKCGGETVTIDIAQGVTPFLLRCRAGDDCDGMAESTFYRPADQRPGVEPSFEWFRPEDPKRYVRKNFEKRDRLAILEHIAKGGLVLRPIVTKAEERDV